MTLRFEPADKTDSASDTPRAGAARPRGTLRHTPKSRRDVLPGTTVQPRSELDPALEVVRERWQEERARRLACIARECEKERASSEATIRAHATTIYCSSPARRANWLDRRLSENAARWARLHNARAAAVDGPAPRRFTCHRGAGVSWYGSHSDRATATVRDATDEPRLVLEVLGDEVWQSHVLHTLWALAEALSPPARSGGKRRAASAKRQRKAPLTLVR